MDEVVCNGAETVLGRGGHESLCRTPADLFPQGDAYTTERQLRHIGNQIEGANSPTNAPSSDVVEPGEQVVVDGIVVAVVVFLVAVVVVVIVARGSWLVVRGCRLVVCWLGLVILWGGLVVLGLRLVVFRCRLVVFRLWVVLRLGIVLWLRVVRRLLVVGWLLVVVVLVDWLVVRWFIQVVFEVEVGWRGVSVDNIWLVRLAEGDHWNWIDDDWNPVFLSGGLVVQVLLLIERVFREVTMELLIVFIIVVGMVASITAEVIINVEVVIVVLVAVGVGMLEFRHWRRVWAWWSVRHLLVLDGWVVNTVRIRLWVWVVDRGDMWRECIHWIVVGIPVAGVWLIATGVIEVVVLVLDSAVGRDIEAVAAVAIEPAVVTTTVLIADLVVEISEDATQVEVLESILWRVFQVAVLVIELLELPLRVVTKLDCADSAVGEDTCC